MAAGTTSETEGTPETAPENEASTLDGVDLVASFVGAGITSAQVLASPSADGGRHGTAGISSRSVR